MKLFNKYICAAMLTATAISFTACSNDNDEPQNPDTPTNPEVITEASNELIYEVNPRFYGNTGCLAAVTADIDRFADLGVTTLWVMPINTQGSLKSIGSPYCISDFMGVDPRLGTLDDFKALVNAAHARGMKVILDWIANHTAWDCAWVAEHPEWYTRDANGNIIAPAEQNWTDVADLNYDNQELRAAMIDAMCYWITEADIDGFRCDYADGVPVGFWQEAISEIRSHKADAMMLGETNNNSYFSAGFDMKYGWNFASALSKLFSNGNTSSFFDAANSDMKSLPEGARIMRYSINHDTAAETSLVSLYGNADALEAATVLAIMLDGTPMIYTGNEIDYTGTLNFFTYGKKTFNADKHEALKAITAAYRATKIQRGGALRSYQADHNVVFTRTQGDKVMLVMVNTTNNTVTVKTPIAIARTTMIDALTDTTVNLPAGIELPPYGYAIYYK